MMRVIVAAVVSLFAVGGCGIPTAPDDVFDEYVEAYAVGDVEMLWELSAPSARADAERLRKQLLAGLEHPELSLRVHFEGTFGVTAADLRSLSPRNFFYWAVAIVRRRLGVGFIRSTMRRIARIRIEDIDSKHKVVVYRQADALARMVLVAVERDIWRVEESPFSQQVATPPTPPQSQPDDE